MPEDRFVMGSGTLSVVLRDGTRIEMVATNVNILHDRETLTHRSGFREEPDREIVINQTFKMEAEGRGLQMFVDGLNEPRQMGEVVEPLEPGPVSPIVELQKIGLMRVIRVIRMTRREE